MNRNTHGIALQLVAPETTSNIVRIDNPAAVNRERHLLGAEALAIEAEYGSNPYSNYLRMHFRRPTPTEAATMGRALGGRVKASDGSMQPPLSHADRAVIAAISKRRANVSRRYDQIVRLRMAIAALAENGDDPADVILGGSVLLNDREITLQLQSALEWLTRFAKEWGRREETCAGSKKSAGSAQVAHGYQGSDVRIHR